MKPLSSTEYLAPLLAEIGTELRGRHPLDVSLEELETNWREHSTKLMNDAMQSPAALEALECAEKSFQMVRDHKDMLALYAGYVRNEVDAMREMGVDPNVIDGFAGEVAVELSGWWQRKPSIMQGLAGDMKLLNPKPSLSQHPLQDQQLVLSAEEYDHLVTANSGGAGAVKQMGLIEDVIKPAAVSETRPALTLTASNNGTLPDKLTHTSTTAETGKRILEAESKSHSKSGFIIAAIVAAVGIGTAMWYNRCKQRETTEHAR